MQFWSFRDPVPYEEAGELQLKLTELRHRDLIPDTLLFLEHSAVITRGRGLQFNGGPGPKHMPLIQALPADIQFAESERGGDLTYHGPGQLVMYPICKLDGSGFAPHRDVGGYLRKLENLLIEELAGRGIVAQLKKAATGVWIGEKKIASLGIAVRKWVSYHGIALNCVNDLKPYYLILPCGFRPEVMTRLSEWIPISSDWRQSLENSISQRIEGNSPEIHSITLPEAFETCLSIVEKLPLDHSTGPTTPCGL